MKEAFYVAHRFLVCVAFVWLQLITAVVTLLHVWTVMFHKTFVSAVVDSTTFVALPVLTKCVQGV
jgi:hypothetical protein